MGTVTICIATVSTGTTHPQRVDIVEQWLWDLECRGGPRMLGSAVNPSGGVVG